MIDFCAGIDGQNESISTVNTAPAGAPSPPPSVDVACRTPTNARGSSHDEPDTVDRLNGPTPYSLITGDFSTLLIELA